ncbi:hypothetical protein DKM44_03310 [Deinococcus irradiatisoli]|uniref:DUF11 domain-containing protein n=1 Tax=Deinococcus irradiatisoli TaxID=2202254 RepID=A0A2Z3JHG5_9DEIO|nr:hypothetical protein DKM44_03310 [Deinococcus irradiatisoli]
MRLPRTLATLSLLTLLGLAQAAGTPAGTVIVNQAAATASVLPDEPPVNTLSNEVKTTVAAVCALSVTPDGTVKQPGQQRTVLPGESALFAYRIVNTGNTAVNVPLTSPVAAESAFIPTTTLYIDSNDNGQLEDAERKAVSHVELPADGSASLLLLAQSDEQQIGDAFVNVSAGCAGQAPDDNNVALLRLGAPPVLALTKTFNPTLVKPGDQTTVTLTAFNTGQGASREVVLSDDLSALAAQGLTFVGGSASASGGQLEYGSGSTWQASESGTVQALRVRLDSLKPGGLLTLTFRMLAGAQTENKTFLNTALATTGKQSVQALASLLSQYTPQVALGPIGNPEAAEGSTDDEQEKTFGLVGKEICFDQTLKNTGDVQDSYALSGEFQDNGGTLVFRTLEGQALSLPLTLSPQASRDFKVCLVPQQTGPLKLRLLARGQRFTENATLDRVTAVQAGLPELLKSVSPSGMVPTGTILTYTLTVRNPYTLTLHDLVIRDSLNSALEFVSADSGGALESGAVVWRLPSLAPGESRTFTIRAKVGAQTADGTNVTNTFDFTSSELPEPLPSNQTSSPVWTSKLVIEKQVSQAGVTYGDRLTYTLTLRNLSAQAPLVDGVVTDTPAAGLDYVPGSATLAGQPLADPQQDGGHLIWTVGTLPAGGNVVITYQMRVNAKADDELLNSVVVSGKAVSGLFTATITSNQATAKVKLQLLMFAPLSDIVGTVYIDRNRDGRFEAQIDQPLERARILLAGGREVLTDAQGRYHFKDVAQGVQALRLDPQSVPSVALSVPMDGGLSGTRTLNVLGLSAADFPLAPLTGDIDVLRSVSLSAGPLTLEKTVQVSGERYSVTLHLKSAQALPGFVLDDTLPAGAQLKEGRNTLAASLGAGETTVTYTFDWAGERRAAVTEPDVRWTY